MAIKIVPLADGNHSAIHQIRLCDPAALLADGRIVHFLSRLTSCCSGAQGAWELLFTSVPGPTGTTLDARLITHASVPAAQRGSLQGLAAGTQAKLLAVLQENGIAAQADDAPPPPLRDRYFIPLCKQGNVLFSEEIELTPGLLTQHLCARPGNGFSLLLILSGWQDGELNACAAGLSEARKAMLARDPVFNFVVTLWGPDADDNVRWLQGMNLAPCTLPRPVSYPACLRNDPWRLLTLLPSVEPRPTLMTLSELLTLCGCPAEPGEMQRMCRMSWRDHAAQALQEANIALLPMDMTLTEDDLAFMGLHSDADLENVLYMDRQMGDMLRMCVAILRKLDCMGNTPAAASAPDRQTHLTGLLLPTVGHIYEQFVRECCYETMYCPYYTCATGRRPAPVVKVFLSTYDLGPGVRGYQRVPLPANASETAAQSIIREQMIDDFTNHALIAGKPATDDWWYALFNDMNTARVQRNGLTHELANLRSASAFAKAFLQERRGCPSLLRRLLMCRHIATNFPAS